MGFFVSSRRRHTRCGRDWSSDVCSSDLRDPLSTHPQDLPRLGKSCGCVESGSREVSVRKLHLRQYGRQGARLFGRKIGRASCRERVSTSSSGGALKSKVGEQKVRMTACV